MSSGEGCADLPDRSVVDAVDRLRRGLEVESSARIIHHRFYGPLRSFFARKVPFPHDGEDLTQETFLAAFANIGTFRGEARFSTWLFRIAVNTYNQWERRQRRSSPELGRPTAPVPKPLRLPLVPTDRPSPLGEALESERCRLLAGAIAKLPTQQKRCIVAMFLQERTHREVAVILGLSPATVKSHVYEARRALERALGGRLGNSALPPNGHGGKTP